MNNEDESVIIINIYNTEDIEHQPHQPVGIIQHEYKLFFLNIGKKILHIAESHINTVIFQTDSGQLLHLQLHQT